jgi:hypothetical protein
MICGKKDASHSRSGRSGRLRLLGWEGNHSLRHSVRGENGRNSFPSGNESKPSAEIAVRLLLSGLPSDNLTELLNVLPHGLHQRLPLLLKLRHPFAGFFVGRLSCHGFAPRGASRAIKSISNLRRAPNSRRQNSMESRSASLKNPAASVSTTNAPSAIVPFSRLTSPR